MPVTTGKRYRCPTCGAEFIVTKGGDGGGSAAAVPAQMAMGFGMAQEMMKSMQQTPPPLPVVAAASAIPELLTPAQAAQALGVTEADVTASLEAGDLKGKKIGSSWRITRAALDAFLAE